MFSVCIDAPKGPSHYPKNIMLQFSIKTTTLIECYLKSYATWIFYKKRKLTKISGTKSGTNPLQSVGSSTLFYPVSIMPQFFSSNLKHLKNVKAINNTTGSHLVSCRVIPKPATMQRWEKRSFEKYVLLEI